MRYMRCQCGERQCWTSMGHPSCDVCEQCGSTLAEGPNGHVEQTPHEFYAEIRQGRVETRCIRCDKDGPFEQATNKEEVKAQIADLSKALWP